MQTTKIALKMNFLHNTPIILNEVVQRDIV